MNLATFLSSFSCEDSDEFYDTDLETMIQKEMPGYIVNYYDLDEEFGTENAVDSICKMVKGKRVIDFQVCEWTTDSQDLAILVVAIKTENDDDNDNQ